MAATYILLVAAANEGARRFYKRHGPAVLPRPTALPAPRVLTGVRVRRSLGLEEASGLSETAVQLLAALMATAHAVLWVLATRWGRPGRSVQRRVTITPPPGLRAASNLSQVAPLVYPVLVVVAPHWAYQGWLNWSASNDLVLLVVGLGLWAVGLSALFWAARTIRRYVDVDGLVVDHDLVVHGPYHYVRHPVYSSYTAVAVGTALVFRSYLLVALAVTWVISARWWAAAEEALLASPEGFGDTYRRYAERTGRFLPRVGAR